MNWRIYRLPGSRDSWHIDSGPETQVLNVRGFEIYAPCKSVDIVCGFPRAWIEIPRENTQLHVIGGIAVWQTVAVASVQDHVAVSPVDAQTNSVAGV
jgi:hypothetical protein